MLSDIINFFKAHLSDFLLVLIVFLLCLLSFGAGAAYQFYRQKPTVKIENSSFQTENQTNINN